jgi:hypothetical protein
VAAPPRQPSHGSSGDGGPVMAGLGSSRPHTPRTGPVGLRQSPLPNGVNSSDWRFLRFSLRPDEAVDWWLTAVIAEDIAEDIAEVPRRPSLRGSSRPAAAVLQVFEHRATPAGQLSAMAGRPGAGLAASARRFTKCFATARAYLAFSARLPGRARTAPRRSRGRDGGTADPHQTPRPAPRGTPPHA